MVCLEMTASVPQLILGPMAEQLCIAKLIFFPGYPYCQNINGMEITIIRLEKIHQVTIVSVYRSPKVITTALQHVLAQLSTQFNIFIGDFNINYLVDNTLKRSLIISLLEIISTGNWYRAILLIIGQ